MADRPPVTTLLSWAWIAMAIEVDDLVEASAPPSIARRFRISVAMWSNGLRLIDPGGITLDVLQRRARSGCNVPGLERWGWVTIGGPSDPADPGVRRDGHGPARGLTR